MFPSKYIRYVQDYFPSGSRVICNPPPTDTDEDWAVYFSSHQSRQAFIKVLLEDGFVHDGKNYENDTTSFASYRKDELNLILFTNAQEYSRYKLATKAATALNLLNKDDRIALFQIIRDANFAGQPRL